MAAPVVAPTEHLIVIVDASAAGWRRAEAVAAAAAAAATAAAEAAAATAAAGLAVSAGAPPPVGRVGVAGRRLAFEEFLRVLHLFLAAYAACDRRAALAVIGYDGERGGYAWPPSPPPPPPSAADSAAPSPPVAGTEEEEAEHLRGAAVTRTVTAALRRLRRPTPAPEEYVVAPAAGSAADRRMTAADAAVLGAEVALDRDAAAGTGVYASAHSLAPALSLALCRHHAVARRAPGGATSRILVFSAGGDAPSQYIAVANAIFSAQRYGVSLDAVAMAGVKSVALQQAAHLTGGTYSEPTLEQHAGLFQFLVMMYLPPPPLRSTFALPAKRTVDLRAACFCHKRHVDVAWVCAVCLSIWCDYTPACLTCGATSATPTASTAPPLLPGPVAPAATKPATT